MRGGLGHASRVVRLVACELRYCSGRAETRPAWNTCDFNELQAVDVSGVV